MQQSTRKRRRSSPLGIATKQESYGSVLLIQVLTLLLLTDTSALGLKLNLYSRSHYSGRLYSNYVSLQAQEAATHDTAVLDEVETTPSSCSKTSSLVLYRHTNGSGRTSLRDRDEEIASTKLLPPWLLIPSSEIATEETVQTKMNQLEYSLLEHGFSVNDVTDIVRGMLSVTSGSSSKLLGCIGFCRLILDLEEPRNSNNAQNRFRFATKDVLLASILHFVECFTAREQGVYGRVLSVLESPTLPTVAPQQHQDNEEDILDHEIASLVDPVLDNFSVDLRLCQTEQQSLAPFSSPLLLMEEGSDVFTDEIRRLARGAARIKRSEILTDVVLAKRRGLTKSEYADVRDMLLTLMEDWRALGIRCVASLYRLDGILQQGVDSGAAKYIQRSPEAIRVARESMRVYVNLAQRLGLHRLKSQLESRAFRILYPKQYRAVSAIFRQSGQSMGDVSAYLESQMKEVFYRDESLMSQLDDLDVTSRVKEPYSFWRKLLKKRLDRSEKHKSVLSPSSEISVIEVLDGIAIRVVIEARKSSPYESDEDKHARERVLCYYVQHLLASMWPARDNSRIKDYILNPKPNGYQSLHFTSSIAFGAQEYPFEVQVRSKEMHHIAEHGVAAHWSYKTGEKLVTPSLPPSGTGISVVKDALRLASESKNQDKVGFSALTTMLKSTETPESAYIDALVTARNNLVLSNVFVFLAGSSSTSLEGGKLMSLPAGALVSDILRQLQTEYSLETDGRDFVIWRNGKPARLDELLKSGDVILLCTK
jgi:ppGpp synthetase/RelA/SpoT-type nucleotidyltranferase